MPISEERLQQILGQSICDAEDEEKFVFMMQHRQAVRSVLDGVVIANIIKEVIKASTVVSFPSPLLSYVDPANPTANTMVDIEAMNAAYPEHAINTDEMSEKEITDNIVMVFASEITSKVADRIYNIMVKIESLIDFSKYDKSDLGLIIYSCCQLLVVPTNERMPKTKRAVQLSFML